MKIKSSNGSTRKATGTYWYDRFQYIPFWKLTQWGFVGFTNLAKGWWSHGPIHLGSDEWRNPSIVIVLPVLGMFVFFYGKDFKRDTWFLSGSVGTVAHYMSPDYRYEAHVPYHGDVEKLEDEKPLLTHNEIRIKASSIEKLDYYE